MKILLIGPEVAERSKIRDFGGVWSFYLARELRGFGHDVVFCKASDDPAFYAELNVSGVDHAIAIGGRFWSKVSHECWKALKQRIPGAVGQISDRKRSDPVDINFCVVPDKRVVDGRNYMVGWAADAEVCTPRQRSSILTILLDHPNYGDLTSRIDLSGMIADQAAAFVRSEQWRPQFKAARLLRIEDGGVREVDLDNPAPPVFTRAHIPFEQVCEFYSQAHLFLPTHPESAGLSVLETSLAGAFSVVCRGFINPLLLETVRHLVYSGNVPWDAALAGIDIKASREMALPNSWTRVAKRIVSKLEQFA